MSGDRSGEPDRGEDGSPNDGPHDTEHMERLGNLELQSVITCPQCGHRETETMPTDACQFFYDCAGCGAVLRPKQGDCCVYCSFGSVPCPSVQEAGRTGNTASCRNG
jgi:hypothetical protein